MIAEGRHVHKPGFGVLVYTLCEEYIVGIQGAYIYTYGKGSISWYPTLAQ